LSLLKCQNALYPLFCRGVDTHNAILRQFTEIPPNPVMPSSWAYFLRLEHRTQTLVVREINQLNSLLLDAVRSGVKLTSDRRLTWFAISRLGMVPCSDAFEQIRDSDFVEIYNTEGIQIFRNLEFYRLISYTIAEITLHPWYRLYGRDERFADQIRSEAFGKALDGRRETFRPAIESHDSFEVMSLDQRRFHILPGVISPLFDKSGRAVAFLATSNRHRIDAGVAS